jgi:DNA polymerase III delta prime subunit
MIDHHAVLYLTASGRDYIQQLATDSTAEWLVYQQDSLLIGDVRRIIEQAYQRPGEHEYRVIALVVNSIAIEAQHALLKIIEEPPITTRFVFVMPTVAGLLPTVQSRLHIVTSEFDSSDTTSIQNFMALTIPERLAYVAELTKKKDETALTTLQASLITLVHERQALPQIVRVALSPLLMYLRLRGAAKKMIWEEIAFVLPIAK